MSDNYFQEPSKTAALRSWVTWHMLRGMAMAALFVVVIGLVLGGIWAVGQLLPAESKTAPSPFGQIQLDPAAAKTALV